MFSILNEIADPRPVRTTGVVMASTLTAASIYLLVAITGYLSYGSNVLGNIVAQYTPAVASTIGRAAIVVLVMFSYPLQVHPCRASVDAVSKWRPVSSATKTPPRQGVQAEEMGELRFAVITTCIILASYVVAMTVSSLDVVLAYVGSTGSTSISFILPGLFYWKISAPEGTQHQRLMKDEDDEGEGETIGGLGREARQKWLRRASLALAGYGLCVMVTCLATNTFLIVAH